MATSKLVRMSIVPLRDCQKRDSFSGSCKFLSARTPGDLRCLCKVGFGMDHRPSVQGHCNEKKQLEVKASLLTTEPKTEKGIDLGLLFADVTSILVRKLNVVTRARPWKFPLEAFIEKAIVDCRFFTLLAVGGSLIGSLLCFLDGCFLILETYFQYFHVISQKSDQGHILHLLLEAIDMFLVAIAMLVFGIGLHVSFVGSYPLLGQGKVSQIPRSNYLKNVLSSSSRGGMRSIMQAKSKIGQAVIMMLQVGVLDKFSSVPLVTGFDLACFAAAVFLSAACIFLLSKLTINASQADS